MKKKYKIVDEKIVLKPVKPNLPKLRIEVNGSVIQLKRPKGMLD